ncbi:family 1 glycosylhydrolase [Candidatus Saccharibacteria bacterium]|nr:family 1 glycosylhydrolase [Candidatus Saccharibacteria bacterium]
MDKDSQYPKGFLWGTATAAHQVEGDNNNQWTRWEQANAARLGREFRKSNWFIPELERFAKLGENPENYISGRSTDHYHRYEEDFKICQKLGFNSFRFSVEWSRIEPRPGEWSAPAIQHYKKYIKSMRAHGLEPVLTLFHFTTPTWFADRGGFLKRKNVRYFTRFCQKVIKEIAPDVNLVITINEPEVFASAGYLVGEWPPMARSKIQLLKVIFNLAHAHNITAPKLREINHEIKLSIATDSVNYYPGNKNPLTKLAVWVWRTIGDDFFLSRVRKNCDFIGVNYYFASRMFGFKFANGNKRLSDLGWDMRPMDINFVLKRLWKKYGLPLLITENGLADKYDKNRQWWLAETFASLEYALEQNVPILGYLHWSLLDNFEWARGAWPCFGLVGVDYNNDQRRVVRSSAHYYADYIKKHR